MNNTVEAGGRASRLIAIALCLPLVVLTSFAIQAGTRAYGGSAVSQSTVMSRPLLGSHITRADLETAIAGGNRSESLRFSESDSEQVPPPTRSSFMAHWPRVPGAKGYRLDVSSESSFSTFVEGFHDLDVGERASRLVTGLRRGTTYYYRVRAYDSTRPSTSAASAVMSATGTRTTPYFIQEGKQEAKPLSGISLDLSLCPPLLGQLFNQSAGN